MIRRAWEKDLYAVKELADLLFGDPYISLDEYRRFTASGYLFVDEERGALAAAALFYPVSAEELLEEMDVSHEEKERLCRGKEALHFRFLAVHPDRVGQGRGFALLTESLRKIKEDGGFGAAFSQFWVRRGTPEGEKQPMEYLGEKAGFRFLHEQKEPWFKEKYSHCICSVCGGMCRCNARVYVKEL